MGKTSFLGVIRVQTFEGKKLTDAVYSVSVYPNVQVTNQYLIVTQRVKY